MTTLYIVGCEPEDVPDIPIKLGEAPAVIRYSKTTWRDRHTRPITKPEVTKPEREHTPPAFAAFLLETARRCGSGRGPNR